LDDFVAEKEQPIEEGEQFYIVGTVQVIGETGIEQHTPDDKEYRVFMQAPVR
jgi:predicted metal-dependent TIM-barrel fold hydrolase